jgi:hypothetical protein
MDPPRQAGKPINDLIFNVIDSRDGRVAVSRGTQTSDVVLIATGAPKTPEVPALDSWFVPAVREDYHRTACPRPVARYPVSVCWQ